ncbi:DNA/RNA non-specific endonuclease [Microbacterium ulmi]|uniref:Nuclease n=1 Tax=Microbacterium ulmi TaxID=179095 RepID=A0A7Y2LZR5_9MICO|nr:DNA/RNA non-specific endonuclease [Microbacterium ulmi]NII69889.1 endonuclease G [Microbacterium ulmi]NNH03809.1 nuclease [Microbacterium ulmi]
MKTARERLAESEVLRAAVQRRIDGGLLERMGLPDIRVPAPGEGADADVADRLESIDPGGSALEAIVQLVGRPPLLVQNDRVVFGDDEIDSLDDFPPGTDARIRATEKFIPSVGRVEFTNFTMAWGGTGWVIAADGADRIVVTNRHVASLVARRTADGHGVFMRGPSQIRFGASLDFNEEFGAIASQATPFDVVDIPYLADTTAPDVALLRITGQNLPSPLPLADTDAAFDDVVALVGYPAYDDRNDKDAMARYFRQLYNVKRYAPGRITQALGPRVTLQHDCTSLGGASGSPLIRLSDGRVVGLHFSGLYGKFNSAVGASTLRQLLAGARPVADIAAVAGATEAAGDGQHGPDQLADRAGYDPAFLGGGDLSAPWPGLPADVEGDLARPSDESASQPFELRYTHFGVKFSRSRKQPRMTAVNIDGRHPVAIKRGSDRWFHDGRIPRDIQLGKNDYAHPDIDRGHMVRRQDPNWDDTLPAGGPGVSEIAQRANDDTFHYTNAAVQHGDLNSGARQWLGLEDYILNSAKTHGFTACVFTGPVLRDDDPEIAAGVVAPREFFKLVVMESAVEGTLHATAYVLSQGEMIRDLLEERGRTEAVEGFELGAYRTFQVAIADLAAVTGYDFSRYVPFDPLAALATSEAADAGEPVFVPLDAISQIVL